MRRNHNKQRPRKRDYDPISDRYTLTDRELANLAIGRANNAAIGAANAAKVHKLLMAGQTVSDVMLVTGLSRPTVYRAIRRLGLQPGGLQPGEQPTSDIGDSIHSAWERHRAMGERRALRAEASAAMTAKVYALATAGHSSRDVALITGLSTVTIYKHMRRALGLPPHDGFKWPAPRDPLLL